MIQTADDIVWGPVMLIFLMGTGIYLTIRFRFATWKNLGYALKITLSKDSRTKEKGDGDISSFSALMTALAATIGTGNIVGVATAMVSGGPGALVWMWISAVFGLSLKFSECMLAIKYREVNANGEMIGGPMYTMKKAFKNQRLGSKMGWFFALFAVIASFGVGNMTQSNSISEALKESFFIPEEMTGVVVTILALIIIVGGIQNIAKVSAVVVPVMAIFYMVCGVIVILGNIDKLWDGLSMTFQMAFSVKAVGGGLCGTITAGLMNSLRYGVARGVFSNEAGMGSAAITAAAAATDNPVRQGYVNMTGTFWDTIVVCTITGICIATSGVLGTTELKETGKYAVNKMAESVTLYGAGEETLFRQELEYDSSINCWSDSAGNQYFFYEGGAYEKHTPIKGAALTILAFESVLGETGGYLVSIGIVLFAFATIIGWEYHGEKAFEYLVHTHKYNMLYRVVFSLMVYVGATTALDIVWGFSDIANALMAVPNLICLLALSKEAAKDVRAFESIRMAERGKQ
ncbi:MAG: sodium:alanine symporter family protein [Lachnospiraceae bacterium]|nr:sodium:alanine symporter family protein [Lachnospiraceae bacterium]